VVTSFRLFEDVTKSVSMDSTTAGSNMWQWSKRRKATNLKHWVA
jgi:hypothetical protein